MPNILITGATGFIGRSLIPYLRANGHRVRCAVSKRDENLQTEQVLINKLDSEINWSEALSGIEIVIHLAAKVHVMKESSGSTLKEYCRVNSVATKNFAEQAAKAGVKRFVFLSSIKVNGELTTENQPFTEESPTCPEDPYAYSKLLAEHYLQAICQNSAMEVVILRPPLVYGPEVKANFLKLLVQVKKAWFLPFGRVRSRRSFIYIDNLVSAIDTVMQAPQAANQLYLVADDDALSLAELLALSAFEMKSNLKLVNVPFIILKGLFFLPGLKQLRKRLLCSLVVSNNKLYSQLGWTPPVAVREGLKRTVLWFTHDYNS